MRCSNTRFLGSGDVIASGATLRKRLRHYGRNCMPALVAGTSLAALLLIVLHAQPSRVWPADRGHQTDCDLMRCR